MPTPTKVLKIRPGQDIILLDLGLKEKIKLEVIVAAVKWETIVHDAGLPENRDNPNYVFKATKEWFQEDHDVELNATQAHTILSAIEIGYDLYKKKLEETLVSHFGLDSTPDNSPIPPKTPTWFSYLFSWLRRKSKHVNPISN